jgi:hypothetical protein
MRRPYEILRVLCASVVNPRFCGVNSQIRATVLRLKMPSEHNFLYSSSGRDLPRFGHSPKHEFFDKFVQHRAIIEGRRGPKRPSGSMICD